MSISREISIQHAIKNITNICNIQQYDRLISGKLFKYEKFHEVYYKQMKILEKLEEYEKCAQLLKIVANMN